MNRREALKNVAFLMGGIISATTLSIVTEGCTRTSKEGESPLFGEDQQKIIDEFADIIIPTTDSPGAKAAGVGMFISTMIQDCYPQEAQKKFLEGLEDVEKRSQAQFSKSFLVASVEERTQLVKDLVQDTKQQQKEDKKNTSENSSDRIYFFPLIKELTLLGYFTSEAGATQALSHVAVPGRYDGCVSLEPGQKAWST